MIIRVFEYYWKKDNSYYIDSGSNITARIVRFYRDIANYIPPWGIITKREMSCDVKYVKQIVYSRYKRISYPKRSEAKSVRPFSKHLREGVSARPRVRYEIDY